MEDRVADSEPTGVASSETRVESTSGVPSEPGPPNWDDEDFSWPTNTSQTLVIGCSLTAVSGVVGICSLLSMVQLLYLKSVEKMFGYNAYNSGMKFSPMTIAFLVISVSWTAFCVAMLVVNAMLLNSILKGRYEQVRRSALTKAVVNALGTNGILVTAFLVFFSDRYSPLAPGFGIVLLIAGVLQAGLAMALFIYGRNLGVPSDVEPVKAKSIRRRERPMERISRMLSKHRNTFSLA